MRTADTLLKVIDGDNRTDLNLFIRSIMKRFGGPEGLAEQLHLDWQKTTPGSAVRLKTEMAIVALLEKFAIEDEELPEDDEQLAALARQLEEGDRE